MTIADWIADWRLVIGDCSFCQFATTATLHVLKPNHRSPPFFLAKTDGSGVASPVGMNPKAEALKARVHDFFVRVIALCDALPKTTSAQSIAEQLVDAAGSADSNYGCACKGRSRRQFIDKVGVAAEEANESQRWLEALRNGRIGDRREVIALAQEAKELASIFSASHRTAKQRLEEQERQQALDRAQRRSRRPRNRQ